MTGLRGALVVICVTGEQSGTFPYSKEMFTQDPLASAEYFIMCNKDSLRTSYTLNLA